MAAPTPTLATDAPSGVTIGAVLREPHVLMTLVASIVARLPYGALSLLTVLKVTDGGYGYGAAGLVAGAYAAAIAIGLPVLSRIVDRDGQTRLLRITALTGGTATVSLALLPGDSPLVVYVLLALVNGALQPPLGGVMRALWDQMLRRDDQRHVGYSLDAIAVEFVFTGGPLVLVGGVAALTSPTTAMLVAAALTTVGTLVLASRPPSRAWKPSTEQHSSFFGALRSPGVQTLMVAALGLGGMFGTIELGLTAYGREEGELGLVGALIAIWSIGSMLGGFAIARVRPASRPGHRIAGILLAMAGANLLLGLTTSPWALGAVLAVAGAGIAPTMATANGAMGSVAPPGMLTEAFGWTLASIMIGSTVIAPLAGLVVDHASVQAALSASAVPPALGAAGVWLRRRTIAPRAA
ncbi:MAG: MFS transporter [Patulibacter minatonensis]